MILRITKLQLAGAHRLKLAFNDGTQKTVDVYPLLSGPIFEPLKNPQYFAKLELDALSGAPAWSNGADLAPEALHALSAAGEVTAA